MDGTPQRTVIGWQGMRCLLPPDWNVTGFSMSREEGYLRVDAPGNSTLTVQIRWFNAARGGQGSQTLSQMLAPGLRRLLRRPEPPQERPNLRTDLESLLKETAKQSRRERAAFESTVRPEKTEGADGERTAIGYSWSGAGRGQGKIWHCRACNRVVVAQVLGLQKDQSAIAKVASELFSTLQDHAEDGYDRWALYDLQLDVPESFRLDSQKLLSGYLRLVFARGAERIFVDRWGLANMARKRFTLQEWFANHAAFPRIRSAVSAGIEINAHQALHYVRPFGMMDRLSALREARGVLRRFPVRYEGGAWECEESNRIYAVQVLSGRDSADLWKDVVRRCVCH